MSKPEGRPLKKEPAAPERLAAELSLSVKTVSTYRARILEKMNLGTNAELIHYAIQNRLIG